MLFAATTGIDYKSLQPAKITDHRYVSVVLASGKCLATIDFKDLDLNIPFLLSLSNKLREIHAIPKSNSIEFGEMYSLSNNGHLSSLTGKNRKENLPLFGLHPKNIKPGNSIELIGGYKAFSDEKKRVLALIEATDPNSMLYDFDIPEEFRDDWDVVYAAVRKLGGYGLSLASDRLKSYRAIVLAAVTQNGFALNLAPHFKSDKDMVFAAVTQNGLILRCVPNFNNDKDIVLAAVTQNDGALEYASKELQNDPEVVITAFKNKPISFQFASKRLKSDRNFILHWIKTRYYAILGFASENLRGDREVVLSAVSSPYRYSQALRYASPELQDDWDVVFAAYIQNPEQLAYASKPLRDSEDLFKQAIAQNAHKQLQTTAIL